MRGDAVAGIIILLINVIGGLIIGVMQHNMDLGDAAKNYTMLAIGDGLVAQIPALVISTAAGMLVSRVTTDEDMGQQMIGQLFNRPQALILTATILGVMGLIPGMPHIAFLLLAGLLGALAYYVTKQSSTAEVQAPSREEAAAPSTQDASWEDVVPVDTLGLEVGYRLIPLVDKAQDGDLLKRIKGIRKKFAQEVGFLPPAVHIRDNLELKPNAYRITLKGAEVGNGEAYNGMFLAINPGRVSAPLSGITTQDPTFGLPAVWVEAALYEQAQTLGYTVVDASTVVTTHINQLIHGHSSELLGRKELQELLDRLGRDSPKLVEDLIPKLLPLSTLQKVLHNLLEEEVHIRDMRTIIEVLSEHGSRTQDPDELTAAVRVALGRAIIQQHYPVGADLQVISLNHELERILMQAVQTGTGSSAGFEPGLADTLLKEANASAQYQEQLGLPAVLLVPAQIRLLLSRFLRRAVPQLKVISHAEVPDTRNIKVTSILGSNK